MLLATHSLGNDLAEGSPPVLVRSRTSIFFSNWRIPSGLRPRLIAECRGGLNVIAKAATDRHDDLP